MLRSYGWYEYHEDPWVMRNVKSGQEIRIVEMHHNNKPEIYARKDNRQGIIDRSSKITFLYRDKEIEQFVIMNLNYVDGNKGFGIVIDYAGWLDNPSYGLWRRIDDFLSDAALCWPDMVFEQRSFGLQIHGAWHQGVWNRDFIREYRGVPEKKEHMNVGYTPDPVLIPLDGDFSVPWSHVKHPNPEPKASLHSEENEDFKIRYLSENECPSGFQDKTSYLMRADKKAFIFMSELKPYMHRGEDATTIANYTVVDENMFFTFEGHPMHDLRLWAYREYGLRRLPPEADYYSKYYQLPYKVWKDVVSYIMDAWPVWEKGQRIELDPYNGKLKFYGYVGDYGRSINGGYRGGSKNNSLELRFRDPNIIEETRTVHLRDILVPPNGSPH